MIRTIEEIGNCILIDLAGTLYRPVNSSHARMPFIGGKGGVALLDDLTGITLVGNRNYGGRGITDSEGAAMSTASKLKVFAVPILGKSCEEVGGLARLRIGDKATRDLAESRQVTGGGNE